MSVRERLATALVAGLLTVGTVSQVRAQSEVPPFIEVGKSYVFISMMLAVTGEPMASAEVVEIGPAPWIKVRMSEPEFPFPYIWVNMNAVDAVFEMTPEVQAAFETEFESTRERAYQAAMKSDLRNLVTAQEVYFADNFAYATLEALGSMFWPSTGVTIEINDATATGWSAMASHGSSMKVCYIFIGDAEPPIEGLQEGAPVCQ